MLPACERLDNEQGTCAEFDDWLVFEEELAVGERAFDVSLETQALASGLRPRHVGSGRRPAGHADRVQEQAQGGGEGEEQGEVRPAQRAAGPAAGSSLLAAG